MHRGLSMCAICDGAKSTSEMPCSKVLTEFGKIVYQVLGEGAAAQMAMQATGGLHSPSEKGREVYGNLLYGVHLGRAEEIRTERKQHRRDRWFAVELNVFSLVFGTLLVPFKCILTCLWNAARGSGDMGVSPSADVSASSTLRTDGGQVCTKAHVSTTRPHSPMVRTTVK